MQEAVQIHEEVISGGGIYHSIELTKNTKGYGWSIKVAGGDYKQIKERLVEAEEFCRSTYGNRD